MSKKLYYFVEKCVSDESETVSVYLVFSSPDDQDYLFAVESDYFDVVRNALFSCAGIDFEEILE